MDLRTLGTAQSTAVSIYDRLLERTTEIYRSDSLLLEAPNWASDGRLVLNGAGGLWRLGLDGDLIAVELSGVPDLNNDHVLDPDGEHIYLSANDWQIYRAPLAGGEGVLVTGNPEIAGLMHFLHGVSPDGERLAFIGLEPEGDNWWAHANVFTVSSAGDDYRRLTEGVSPFDGSEYSPDGEWLYVNTERFDGHAQLGRMRADGSDLEQLTFDENVNWFPHISPDGRHASYISFPPGTEGHPPDVWVEIKIVDIDDWSSPRTVARVFGGQGSLNVNSWSPDSTRFAFVSYPENTK
ncbi:TolB family protein [Subtercola frigoramans]|uniref:Tol biopolymer transport system component n=1 Tax=Subtercola frigoramans TaxID=120298 RepID=A0ABS2L0L8_9MICO|nr:PD40 domain-containing protein [Subtercola frigoramans]MBM7470481.1 Tol biopolymer transport system component [Subtercola frigoramans]